MRQFLSHPTFALTLKMGRVHAAHFVGVQGFVGAVFIPIRVLCVFQQTLLQAAVLLTLMSPPVVP